VSNLFDNTVGAPSTSTPSNAYSLGTCFTVSDGSAPITGLAWYRGATGSTAKPSNLRLYGASTTVPEREFNGADIVDSGAVGWQVTPFATAFTPASGVHYVAQMTWPGLVAWYFYSRSSLANPASPYAWDTAGVRRDTEFGSTYPGNQDDALAWLLSPVWGTGTGGGGGLTTGDLQNALADWLISTSDNTHQTDGLPWLTKTVVDAVKVVTDKLGASGSGNNLDWIAGLWRLAGDLTDGEIGLLKLLLDRKDQLTGASGGGGSAFFGPEGTQVSAGVETLLGRSFTLDDLGAAIALLRERLDLSPNLADTTRWTLVDTIEGSADALVNVQADAYFFNIKAIPSSHPQMGVAATLWVPRWGWVAPRVHAHFRQRQFTDIFPAVFTVDGLFMDGILVHALPGFEWVCECYTLDRS